MPSIQMRTLRFRMVKQLSKHSHRLCGLPEPGSIRDGSPGKKETSWGQFVQPLPLAEESILN